jgi:hypothetical protein
MRGQSKAGSAGKVVDKRGDTRGDLEPARAENYGAVGSEFEVKLAITASAQPVVFNRFDRGVCSNHPNDSAIAQIVQLFAA